MRQRQPSSSSIFRVCPNINSLRCGKKAKNPTSGPTSQKRLYCRNQQAYRAYKANRTAQQAQANGAFTYIADPDGFAIPVTVYHDWPPFGEW